jgi:hypothetical protein
MLQRKELFEQVNVIDAIRGFPLYVPELSAG